LCQYDEVTLYGLSSFNPHRNIIRDFEFFHPRDYLINTIIRDVSLNNIVLPGMSVCRKIPTAKIDGNIATDEIIRNNLKQKHNNNNIKSFHYTVENMRRVSITVY
jgi:hypothetical protein